MAQRPDLRQISGNIREALADYDRDALLSILTYVFKEYVVEGPPPMLVNQAERLEDLEGASFAELIRALQTRFDHAELSLFEVEGASVSVRLQGALHPLGSAAAAAASRRGGAGLSAPPAAPLASPAAPLAPPAGAPPAAPSRPQPGVRVVETTLTRRPRTPGERVTVTDAMARGRSDLAGGAAEAQRPRRGLSVGGRPTAAGGTMMPAEGRVADGGAPAASQAASDQAAPPAEAPSKDAGGDDASIRFSLLEFD